MGNMIGNYAPLLVRRAVTPLWQRTLPWIIGLAFLVGLCLTAPGCTQESLRIAVQGQSRVEEVDTHVFQQQRQALRDMTFKALCADLRAVGLDIGTVKDDPALALLAFYWNARDEMEFLTTQHERARALNALVVQRYLLDQQGILNIVAEDVLGPPPSKSPPQP